MTRFSAEPWCRRWLSKCLVIAGACFATRVFAFEATSPLQPGSQSQPPASFIGESGQGTLYWYGHQLSKPYRFELADSIGHILVNGLPLRLIKATAPMSKADSVYYQAQFEILNTVMRDWMKLEASGLSPKRAAQRLAVDLKRRSTVIEKVKVSTGPTLQIFWKGDPNPEMIDAPVRARTSRPDPVVKLDPAEPAREILIYLERGCAVFLDNAVTIVPRGLDISAELDSLRQGLMVHNRRLKDAGTVRHFQHPESIEALLEQTKLPTETR